MTLRVLGLIIVFPEKQTIDKYTALVYTICKPKVKLQFKMAFPVEFSGDKPYQCSIFYNYFEGPPDKRDKDQQLSYDFLCLLVKKLHNIETTKLRYYDNLPPNANLLNEMLLNMLDKAEKIVVIVTKGFQDNHWHKHIHQCNLKELLEREELKNFLGISIGMKKSDISRELGMCIQNLVYFADDWQNDDNSWVKLLSFFPRERSTSNLPVEESGGRVDSIEVEGAAAEVSRETDSHEVGEGGVGDSIEVDEAGVVDSERPNPDGADSKGQNANGTDSKGQNADDTDSKGQNADAAAEAPTGIKCEQRETIPDDAESQLLDRKNDTADFEERPVNERIQRSSSTVPVQVSDEGTDSIEVDGAAAEASHETDSHEVGEDGVADSIEVDEAGVVDSERQNADGTDSKGQNADGTDSKGQNADDTDSKGQNAEKQRETIPDDAETQLLDRKNDTGGLLAWLLAWFWIFYLRLTRNVNV